MTPTLIGLAMLATLAVIVRWGVRTANAAIDAAASGTRVKSRPYTHGNTIHVWEESDHKDRTGCGSHSTEGG